MSKTYQMHLISDSTGETVSSVSRAAIAQFEKVEVEENIWSMIRSKTQLDRIIEEVRKNPGIVFYTIADEALSEHLKDQCAKIGVPVVPVINRAIQELSRYFGMQPSHHTGKQHEMDEDYFKRVEIINFALAHDDGQATWDLEEADIVIVGVSRTSKSPTTMYLAYRGYKTANVPYVPGGDFPGVVGLKKPVVVALTISAERLVQIRKSRLASFDQPVTSSNEYTDEEKIIEELDEARRFFAKNKWPVIDVTRKSVEETAALVIQKYNLKRNIRDGGHAS